MNLLTNLNKGMINPVFVWSFEKKRWIGSNMGGMYSSANTFNFKMPFWRWQLYFYLVTTRMKLGLFLQEQKFHEAAPRVL